MVGNKLWAAFFCIIICFAYGFAFGHALIFFGLPLVMFFCAFASALCDGIIIPVIFHHIFMLLYLVAIIIMLQFIKVMLTIFNDLFFY